MRLWLVAALGLSGVLYVRGCLSARVMVDLEGLMHCYEFMCCGQEGGSWFVLTHEVRFTEEDLREVVNQAMTLAVETLLDEGGVAYHHLGQVGDLWDLASRFLRERWGFKDLEFTARYAANAWRDLAFKDYDGEPNANAVFAHLEKQGYTDEFFGAWRAGNDVAMELREGEDPLTHPTPEQAFGANAGTAFRLNEILGRRVITQLIERGW